jgi:hypothetical protein
VVCRPVATQSGQRPPPFPAAVDPFLTRTQYDRSEHMSVAEVVEGLDAVVERAQREKSRIGYFAILYRLTTRVAQEALAGGRFEDPARAERLTSIFAQRYFDTLERFRRRKSTALCWDEALRATYSWRPVVVQHLLLGMNAHINFDLGIAAAQTAPGDELPLLKRDFDAINAIFGGLIDHVERALARIWPTLRLIDAIGGKTDEAILEFSIQRARSAAWAAAERLAVLEGPAQQAELQRIDTSTRALARKILTPGLTLTLVLLAVRAQERGDVLSVLEQLEHAPEVTSYIQQVRSAA